MPKGESYCNFLVFSNYLFSSPFPPLSFLLQSGAYAYCTCIYTTFLVVVTDCFTMSVLLGFISALTLMKHGTDLLDLLDTVLLSGDKLHSGTVFLQGPFLGQWKTLKVLEPILVTPYGLQMENPRETSSFPLPSLTKIAGTTVSPHLFLCHAGSFEVICLIFFSF